MLKESFFCINILIFGSEEHCLPMMELREVIVCKANLCQFCFQSVELKKGWKMGAGRRLNLKSCGILIDWLKF